jgi:SAM-dependent methyltransferase
MWTWWIVICEHAPPAARAPPFASRTPPTLSDQANALGGGALTEVPALLSALPMLTRVTVHDRFEQDAVWGHLADDPKIQHRGRMFEQMIPDDVTRILDVGCGDGAITNRLAERWDVTGLDLSPTALEHVRTTAVQGSATALPFADRSFDLVLSSEMLEHTTDDDYRAALAEMSRVSRRYLLLSVPYREDLAFRIIRCPRCGWRGHVWGHRRSFTPESLLGAVDGFAAVESRIFGPLQEPHWPAWLLAVAHNVLRSYYSAPGQSPMCENCGNVDFTATRTISPALRRLNARMQQRRRPSMPFWMAILATRPSEALDPGAGRHA